MEKVTKNPYIFLELMTDEKDSQKKTMKYIVNIKGCDLLDGIKFVSCLNEIALQISESLMKVMGCNLISNIEIPINELNKGEKK